MGRLKESLMPLHIQRMKLGVLVDWARTEQKKTSDKEFANWLGQLAALCDAASESIARLEGLEK
jgi:hypothetical protein